MYSSPLLSTLLVCLCAMVFFVQPIDAAEPIWISPVADRDITQLAVSADQSRVAGIIGDSAVVVVDAATGNVLDRFTPNERRLIKAVALSPDGTTLYVLDVCYPTGENQECNCLFRRKIVGGAVLDSRIMVAGNTGDYYTHSSLDKVTIRISANGKFAAIGIVKSSFAHDYRATNGQLFLYNSELDSLYSAPGSQTIFPGAVYSLDISSDGSRCFLYASWDEVTGRSSTGYVGERDAYYIDYSIADHKVMRKIDISLDVATTILFSPDNYFLILGRKVYDYPHMQLLTEVSNPLEWMGTGTHIAAWNYNGGRSIGVMNPFTGSEEASYAMEDGGTFGMAKGGSLFFMGVANGSIACWSVPDTIRRSPLSASFYSATTQVQMLDTVRFVNTSSPLSAGTQCFWDFGDGTESRTTHPVHVYRRPGKYTVQLHVRNEHGEEAQAEQMQYIIVSPASDDIVWFDKWSENPVSSLVFSSDGELVAAATGTQQVMLKRAATGESIVLPPIPRGQVDAVAFPGDGKTLYCISSDYTSNFSYYEMYSLDYFPKWYIHKYNAEAKTWTTSATIDLMRLMNRPLYGAKGALKLSTIINAAYGDSLMYIVCRTRIVPSGYSEKKFNPVFVFDIKGDSVYQWDDQLIETDLMSLSSDGSRAVAIYTNDKKIQVLEANTAEVIQQLSTNATASCARFLDSNATIITNEGVWSVEDGRRLRTLSLPDSLLFDVFSQSRAAIVAMPNSDSALAIYAIEKDSIVHQYGGGLSRIIGLAISPDGRFVATGGETGHVAVWRIADAVLPLGTDSNNSVEMQCALVPNPATDYIQITIQTQKASEARIELLDYMGKPVVVRSERCEAGRPCIFAVSIGHMGPGVYICRVSTPDGWQAQTFVVSR
jgi:PKD repeat protein